jgi:Replication-relaxation
MPTDVVAALLRMRHARSAAQLLLRLRTAGLAQFETVRPGLLIGSRPVRLWTITSTGQAEVLARGLTSLCLDRGQLPYGAGGAGREDVRQRDVPLLIATYRLLGDVARGLRQPVRVGAWEHPWIRTVAATAGRRMRNVRLPAAAVVLSEPAGMRVPIRLLLLPDSGTAPLTSYRAVVSGLMELRRTAAPADDEPILVVGVATHAYSDARAEAWQSLLHQVARHAGEPALRARFVTGVAGLPGGHVANLRAGAHLDEAFALIARHPLLTRAQLATLLDTSPARIAHVLRLLVDRGWIRPIPPKDLAHIAGADMARTWLERLALCELTPAGRQEAAHRLLVNAAVARRSHGLTSADVTRRWFVRHLHHTLGANAFFVGLTAAARRSRQHDALQEWRSAAACVRADPRRRRPAAAHGRGPHRCVQHLAVLPLLVR